MPFERPWLVRAVSPKRAIRIPLRLTRLGLFHNFRDLSDPSRPVQNYSQPTARNEDGYEFLRKEAGSWASADFCPRAALPLPLSHAAVCARAFPSGASNMTSCIDSRFACCYVRMKGNHGSTNSADMIGIAMRPGPLPISASANAPHRALKPSIAA